MAVNVDLAINRRFHSDQARVGASFARVPTQLGQELSHIEPEVINDYPSPSSVQKDAGGKPLALQYPGKRPSHSFVVEGDAVSAVAVVGGGLGLVSGRVEREPTTSFYTNVISRNGESSVFNLDDMLRAIRATPMGARYPVIGFGSNANPGQLATKFKNLPGRDGDIVPVLRGKLKGVVPVYAARIGLNGYVFTDLYPEKNATTEIFVNFLSDRQLVTMNASERAYDLCLLPEMTLETADGKGITMPAYCYLGKPEGSGSADAGILADPKGRPIRLRELSSEGRGLKKQFGQMNQAQVLKYIFQSAGDRIASNLMLHPAPKNVVDLIQIIQQRKTDPRLSKLRDEASPVHCDQPLGRVIGSLINLALQDEGLTIESAPNFRQTFEPQLKVALPQTAATFSELNQRAQ